MEMIRTSLTSPHFAHRRENTGENTHTGCCAGIMKIALVLLFVAMVWAVEAVPVPKHCQNLRYTPFSVRKEVCGSDGKTYSNIDHLHYESCTQNKEITYVRDGYCDPEEGKRAQEAHRKFMADYAKRIRQALKEGRPPPYIADAPMPNLDDYPEE